MPALPLHGSSFRKGVKFSVQTTSRGKVPCNKYKSSRDLGNGLLVESNVILGLVVRVESMKLSEAQNSPERALFSVTHLANELSTVRRYNYHFSTIAYLSSDLASTQAHSSTPVPPSFVPPHGLAPQLSSSHLPVLNLKCNSFVLACCKIWPKDRGMYLKCCCSYDWREALLRKLKDASKDAGVNGCRWRRSW